MVFQDSQGRSGHQDHLGIPENQDQRGREDNLDYQDLKVNLENGDFQEMFQQLLVPREEQDQKATEVKMYVKCNEKFQIPRYCDLLFCMKL